MTDTQNFFAANNSVGSGVWYHKLEDVVQKMKDPRSGLDIRDRKWRFRSYKNCFVGMFECVSVSACVSGGVCVTGQVRVRVRLIMHLLSHMRYRAWAPTRVRVPVLVALTHAHM